MGRAYPGLGLSQQPYVLVPESRLRHIIAYLVSRLRKSNAADWLSDAAPPYMSRNSEPPFGERITTNKTTAGKTDPERWL
jgi:hypothetical protein